MSEFFLYKLSNRNWEQSHLVTNITTALFKRLLFIGRKITIINCFANVSKFSTEKLISKLLSFVAAKG